MTLIFEWANIAISALINGGKSGSFQQHLLNSKAKAKDEMQRRWFVGQTEGEHGLCSEAHGRRMPWPAGWMPLGNRLLRAPVVGLSVRWTKAFSTSVTVCNNLLELGGCWQQLFWLSSCFLITWRTACFCQKSGDTVVPVFLKIPHYFPTTAPYLCCSTQHEHVFAGIPSFRCLIA